MRGTMAMLTVAAAMIPGAMIAMAASAQERTGYTQIASGDYARAEQTLVAERRIFPQKPELMLNLAAVYQRTGRSADAQALYADVLAQPNMLMDVAADRTAGSHDIARAGLRKLVGVQMSAR